jgi:hypothetical protein
MKQIEYCGVIACDGHYEIVREGFLQLFKESASCW